MAKFLKKSIALFVVLTMILSFLATNSTSYVFASNSEIVTFSNVIMNVGTNETQRNITWYSNVFAEGEVRYAKKSVMTGDTFPSVYKTAKAVAVRTVGGEYSYKASLMSLEENTEYVYCLVANNNISGNYTFSVNSFNDNFSFGFITDAQLEDDEKEGSGWKNRMGRIKNNFNNLSFMISAGDQINNPVSEAEYDYFMTSEFTSLPISTTVGPGHDDAVLFNEHYNLPNLSSKYGVTTTSSDYFYKYNNVLVMHLNCDNGVYNNHINFIKNAISANPDCTWRVVVLHYSFFSGGSHSSDDGVVGFREALAGKFNELGIDVVLSGHDHNYARSHMMLDDKTISSDIVTGNSVTNPEGTLYLCGATASGTKYYAEVETEYDKFISCKRDGTRSTVTVFDVTDTSLTMNSYFTDKTEIEKFDTFTINKSTKPFKLNSKTGMIEFLADDENTYTPLVNAYEYSSAILRVANSVWEISTDNGESYQSLGINSKDDNYILRINPETKVWEYSSDRGQSYISTDISSSSYSVKYINTPNSSFGDGTDLSSYSTRVYTTSSPDAPAIYMHKGSVAEGQINNWKWEYYLISGDGTPISEFVAGNEYVAYLANTPTPVASVLYVSSTENPENYTYTWKNAWDIVGKCYSDNITVKLAQDTTASDIVKFEFPVNATFDLNGYTLTSSSIDRVFRFATGSTEAVFNIISSRENGTFNCGSKDFMYLDSSSGSTLTVNVGSDDSYPITVKKCAYFVNSGSNFRNASKLNLNVTKTDITFTNTFLRVTNVKTSAGKNTYTVKSKYSNFNFDGSSAFFVKYNDGMYARNASSFIADNCTFKNTYDTSSKPFVTADLWLGLMNFTNCGFDGVALDGSKFPSMSAMIIGDGCSFKNSDTTFAEDSLSFGGANMMLDAGCEVVSDASTGIISVEKNSQSEEVFFMRTVVDGVKKYYPEGTTFQTVLEGCDTTSAKNIEITLGSDAAFTADTTLENATNYNMQIDLAGNKLTVSNKLNLEGSGYNIGILSSKQGGKFVVSGDSAYIQPKVNGTITFGNHLYKKYLKIESEKYIISMGMIPSGSFNANYLYSDVTVTGGNEGILTLNALGKAAITLGVNIKGCNVSIAKGVFSYSPSGTLSSGTNGGVFNADSVINISDSVFTCGDGATTSTNFFVRTSKLKDRYYGKMYVEGSTFTNFNFNGEGIYSDTSDLSYAFNTYYQSLPADYDATKCITVGEGCTFNNYYSTFNDAKTAFSASNISLADGYKLYYDEVTGAVSVVVKEESDDPETPQEPEENTFYIRTEIDGTVKDYEEGTSLSTVLTDCDKAANKNIKITLGADFSIASNKALENASNYNMDIDLAGHKLTISKKFALQSVGYNLRIYSSVEGGKLVMSGTEGLIQPDMAGVITLGSEQYKNYMSVESEAYIVKLGWIPSGTISVNLLHSDITLSAENNGIIGLNALGSASVTLTSEIKGCKVTVANSVICYSTFKTASATQNGGVFTADSQINIKDSKFVSTLGTAASPKGFFGQTTNFKDRYYGTVNFENCVLDKVRINGAGIYSDNSVSYTYNEYYMSLPANHDYSKRIVVGKDCIFYNADTTFNEDFTDFYTNNYNMTLAEKCLIEKTKDTNGTECIKITHIPEFLVSSYKNESGKPTVTVEIPSDGTYTIVFADYEETELVNCEIVTQEFKFGKSNVTGTKNITLGLGDKIIIWNNTSVMTPLCKTFEINK